MPTLPSAHPVAAVRLRVTAQHAAWERPRMQALRVHLGPRDKGGDDPLRLRD